MRRFSIPQASIASHRWFGRSEKLGLAQFYREREKFSTPHLELHVGRLGYKGKQDFVSPAPLFIYTNSSLKTVQLAKYGT